LKIITAETIGAIPAKNSFGSDFVPLLAKSKEVEND
jgi:hypothetical protein